ncbi:hypothetical protein AVEN_136458-1 [Araneus ventricosus]|uniref:Uncharacterized protein n=1 Tax=Araneus ventricosus TaxID=182803 RepID=A0A4Y2JPI8_ARAVE|nr:hypothetical protein AVEN_136458-1 [Araneus ventricosus]
MQQKIGLLPTRGNSGEQRAIICFFRRNSELSSASSEGTASHHPLLQEEQRAIIRFLRLEIVTGPEINRRLTAQYGDSVPLRRIYPSKIPSVDFALLQNKISKTRSINALTPKQKPSCPIEYLSLCIAGLYASESQGNMLRNDNWITPLPFVTYCSNIEIK